MNHPAPQNITIMNGTPARNMSVETFRCLAMFLIVLGHTLSFWCLGQGLRFDEMPYWWHAIVGMIIWHVDGFIAISGWYGIRFSFRKFIRLLAIIAFYAILDEVCKYIFKGENISFSWTYNRGGWFACSYLVLMLCSPILNAAVESIGTRSRKSLFLYWAMMAFAFSASWMPKHFFTGINAIGFGHQTFLMMAFVYLTARCARYCFIRPVPLKRLLSVVFLYVLLMLAFSGLIGTLPHGYKLYGLLIGNHAPTVYCVALALLLIFVWHVKTPVWMQRVVRFLSPSMFGVYLFHSTIIRWNGTSNVFTQTACGEMSEHKFSIVVIAVTVFVISACVDVIRRTVVSIFRPWSDRHLAYFDKKFASIVRDCK